MNDKFYSVVNFFSVLAIMFGLGWLLLQVLGRSQSNSSLAVFEPEYQADLRPSVTVSEPPPSGLLESDLEDTISPTKPSLLEQQHETQASPDELKDTLQANDIRPTEQVEKLSSMPERKVGSTGDDTSIQRPGKPHAAEATGQVASRSEPKQAKQSDTIGQPADGRPEAPSTANPLVDAQAGLADRTILNAGPPADTASTSSQTRRSRSKSSVKAPPGVENQALLPPPNVNQAGGFVTEQEARVALQGVGYDTVSEIVWMAAINDPYLAPNRRRNLIEDLNEDGFPDHRNITVDDLPLIENRMALIEDLFFDAIDDANAEAFLEAYKDLANMYGRLNSDSSR